MIIPVSERIGTLLSSPKQFQIPRYQRDFKWGIDEATELIEDLQSVIGEDGGALFLGTVIFETSQREHLSIVDGQQRLTSLLLLLIACRERAKELGEPQRAAAIQQKIGFIDEATGSSSGCRLVAAKTIRELFCYIAESGWKGDFPHKIDGKAIKRQINRIRPIYKFFKTKVADSLSSKGLTQFLGAIYSSYVFKIEIESDVQALGLFERTNARGVELEVADLLKNYLFSKKDDSDFIEESWAQITANSGNQMLRMLKHFYISKKGHVTKSALYKKIKGYGNDIGAEALTQQLLDFSQFNAVAKAGNEQDVLNYLNAVGLTAIVQHADRHKLFHRSLEALREFGILQHIPVVYASINCLIRCGLQENKPAIKILLAIIDALEKYHFVNNAICERVGNENEKLYSKTCEELSICTDFGKTASNFLEEIKKRNASEDEFVLNFPKKVNYQEGVSLVAYVFDRLNNAGLQLGAGVKIYDPDPRVFRKTHNIEHIFPQNPKAGFVDAKIAEVVDDVGNLLILPSKTNGRLGNDEPKDKIAKLKGALRKEVKHLNVVEDFLDFCDDKKGPWDASLITKRSEMLARKGYKTIWAF
jgi:hypothetical protein